MPGDRRTEADERAVRNALKTLAAAPGLREDAAAASAFALIARALEAQGFGDAERPVRPSEPLDPTLDLDATLRRALTLAVDVLGAERAFLILSDGRTFSGSAESGADEDAGPSEAIVRRVLDSGEPVFATEADASPSARTVACVPLRVGTETLGAVYLDSHLDPGPGASTDRGVLLAFAGQAALAIEHARLFGSQTRVLEAIASGVVTLRPDRSIASFNRAAEKTFATSGAALAGAPAAVLGRFMPEFPELLDTFYESGAVALRAETEGFADDGRELVLEVRLAPFDDFDGRGVVLVLADVTAQRRLQISRENEMARAKTVATSFSRYVAPHVVESLIRDPSSVRLGGDRFRATTLFADVRGFTAMASTLPAERVVEILNAYFEEAVRVVFGHEGLLDKFYGDGVMAVFGPPRVRDDDASRALAAARELHVVVRELGPRIDYPLRISVGLATGDVVAGHFGSAQRMDYTVIGDAVNRANGLQSAAPAGAIYCDEETFLRAAPEGLAIERVAARIKGRAELLPVYAIFADGTAGSR